MKGIKVFIAYFKFSAKKLFMYRIYLVGELLSSLIVPIILSFFMWKSLIENNSIGYNLMDMMKYIVISNAILLFTQVHIERDLESDIKSYKLGQRLLLPIKYSVGVSYSFISKSICKFMIIYLPLIMLTLIFTKVEIRINRLLYFTIALVFGFILNTLFSLIIGLLSFWLTEIWGIAAIRNLLTGLLSGTIFPLDILPVKIQSAMLMTPFPYMTYIPSKLICDPEFNIEIVSRGLLVSLFWTLSLGLTTFLLMRNGFKKYTSNGA